ncbi:oxygenase MpaB family protein [Nannocystaceae bacterium ST9]
MHRAAWARERFGATQADELFAALERVDPIADALVTWLEDRPFDLAAAWADYRAGRIQAEPIRALFESIATPPRWVDWARVDRARGLFERAGIFGGFVLSLRSLMGGYIAPAGNKPLAFSGRLREQVPRRVAETARFVAAVAAPEGLRAGAEGWRITLEVRLMHAQVRRLLWASGRWDRARWAEPINQHDMLATVLLFSEVYVEGLRVLGFAVSQAEAEDWVHLWCVVGWLMGTEAALLPRDYAQAQGQRELIESTQGEPDEDSQALAAALLGTSPEHASAWMRQANRLRLGFARGLSRRLIGGETADRLGIPSAPNWERGLAALPVAIGVLERVRMHVPGVEDELRGLGRRYWAWVVDASLRGRPATYERPGRLAGV